MRALIITGLAAVLLLPQAAQSQTSSAFRGFRIEGNVGGDRFRAEGDKNTKLGFGGAMGFDGVIADKIVVGVEGSYWMPKGYSTDCHAFNGGALCQRSQRELGAAVRVGYLVMPSLLVFGKGGYASDSQRNSFVSTSGVYIVDGNPVGPGYAASKRYSTDGYQVGGGVEYSLTSMVYVSGQYVYSRYDDHTSRQRAMAGVGLRFK